MSFTKSKLWADLPEMVENEVCSSCIYSSPKSNEFYTIFLGRNQGKTHAVHWCYCRKTGGVRIVTATCVYYEVENRDLA